MNSFLEEQGYVGDGETFTKRDVEGKKLTVCLWWNGTIESPVLAVLKCVTMTSELNFISWSTAYSLTPRATFTRKGAFPFEAERWAGIAPQQNIAEGIQNKF
jgi:hypothetical protein